MKLAREKSARARQPPPAPPAGARPQRRTIPPETLQLQRKTIPPKKLQRKTNPRGRHREGYSREEAASSRE